MQKIFGINDSDIIEFENIRIHKQVLPSLIKLKESAKEEGFDLQVTSCYRSFEIQKNIWNNKAKGLKVLLDDHGLPLNPKDLSPVEIMWSILRWSALPGASRHHWGTDLDVFDKSAITDPHFKVELTPQEVNGIFKPFHDWLSEKISRNHSFSFFRPYHEDLGGVAPEMWHLSFHPLAQKNLSALTFEKLHEFLEQQNNFELKNLVLDHLDEIYEQYVINISPCPF